MKFLSYIKRLNTKVSILPKAPQYHCLSHQVSKVNDASSMCLRQRADSFAASLSFEAFKNPTFLPEAPVIGVQSTQRRSREQRVHLAWHPTTAWAFLRAPQSITTLKFHLSAGFHGKIWMNTGTDSSPWLFFFAALSAGQHILNSAKVLLLPSPWR